MSWSIDESCELIHSKNRQALTKFDAISFDLCSTGSVILEKNRNPTNTYDSNSFGGQKRTGSLERGEKIQASTLNFSF